MAIVIKEIHVKMTVDRSPNVKPEITDDLIRTIRQEVLKEINNQQYTKQPVNRKER